MRPALALVGVALVSLALAAPSASLARFTKSGASTASFAVDTLDPPTSLAAGSPVGLTVSLSWTITPDTYATGYRLYRSTTSGSGYSLVATINSRTTTSTTNTALIPGTYYYVLRSFTSVWQSTTSNEISVLLL